MNNRILIIDESEHYVLTIVNRLLNYGYEDIVTANNGTDGFSKIDLFQPRVVAIDTRLSDVDGFKLCRRIKRQYGESVKVVLMAGLREEFSAELAESAGADAWAVKTFDGVRLLAAIKKSLYLTNLDIRSRLAIS
jgi:DNA-binding response OmpR family regulator